MKLVHKLSAITVVLTLTSFWVALIVSDFFLDNEALAVVRKGIVFGLIILIPAMILAKVSGGKLAANHTGNPELIEAKKKRAKWMAINGALIMVPAAFYLYHKSSIGEIDDMFRVVQAIELLVGSIQYYFVISNVKGGIALRNKGLQQSS